MLLEYQLSQVISCKSDVIRRKDFSYLPEYLTYNAKRLYIMSDQRKCGLTFPLELLKVLYEELDKTFPDWDFNLFQGYLNAYVKRGRQMRQIKNGVGLGMMNASISLVTAILFEIWKEDQLPEYNLTGKFYNDDQIIRLYYDGYRKEVDPAIAELGISWNVFMESYGLQVHKKKPVIMPAGIFLEQYGEDFPVCSRKRCQKVGNLFHTLCAGSIAEAKEIFSASIDSLPEEFKEEGLNLLPFFLSYWGYELHPLEYTLPTQIGGWRRFFFEGVDSLFEEIGNIPEQTRRLTNLLRVERPTPRRKLSTWKGPGKKRVVEFEKFSKLYKQPTWLNYYQLVVTSLRQKRLSGRDYLRYESTYLKMRREAILNKPLNGQHLYDIYLSKMLNEGKTYMPPPSIRELGEEWSSYTPVLESGENYITPPIDPIRLYLIALQKQGQLDPHLKIWSPIKDMTLSEVMYWLGITTQLEPHACTPLGLLWVVLVGPDALKTLLEKISTRYGRWYLPKPTFLEEQAKLFFPGCNTDDQIIWCHDIQGAFTGPPGSILEQDEIRRAQWYLCEKINDQLQRNPIPGYDYFEVRDWTWLVETLAHPSYRRARELRAPDIAGELPVDTGDYQADMSAIIAQIYHVSSLHAEEHVMRSGLAGQIYGRHSDSPDFFDDEEGGLMLFGDE
jgi:hypothetical protein